jgi:putative acetyltransferase
LAPQHLREAFEAYIERSLAEEIDVIQSYYTKRNGGFWVALENQEIVGMFGLEASAGKAMELRRMYVDPDHRRKGIARSMLAFAEHECRRRHRPRLSLSTSELQPEAVAFYRSTGYRLEREEVSLVQSNKSLGGGIKRYHFAKEL